MDFQKLVDVYTELERISSGNAMREILSTFFKQVPAADVAIVAYLTLGQISSQYNAIVLGLAEKSILKAIAMASGSSPAKVKEVMDKTGDVGITAEQFLAKKPRTLVPLGTLTIQELFTTLHKISEISGSGSQDQKTNLLVALLQKTSPAGAKYISRIVLGTLRMGVGDMTVLDSLAIAYSGEKKNKEFLEKAYNICPDVGVIAEIMATKGLKGLEKIDIHVGRPIKMMLAQRVDELEDVPKKIKGNIVAEGKYDGERVQAHRDKKGKITLFSRRLDTITEQFPDLIAELEKNIQAKEFVLEGEILAMDEAGKSLPFQTLMQRRRKYDVEEYAKKIPIAIKIFDLLYWNGKSFLHEPLEKRIKKLEEIVTKTKVVMLSDKRYTTDVKEMNDFFQKMLQEGYEGVIFKGLETEYQAGTRGWNWIKWKKEYVQELSDTFDLVIVGAYYGKGKRSGTYGALLCACYNEKDDIFETVCKVGTGLTDEMLEELPKRLKKWQVDKKPARVMVKKEMEPDVWFMPHEVMEVLAAEVTKSPFHTADVALRFPRFIRFREDKKAEQATTKKEIVQMMKGK